MTMDCLWCNKPLPSGPARGSPRRYCSPSCRHALGTAARRWVMLAVEAGVVPVDVIKRVGEARTLSGTAMKRPGISGTPQSNP